MTRKKSKREAMKEELLAELAEERAKEEARRNKDRKLDEAEWWTWAARKLRTLRNSEGARVAGTGLFLMTAMALLDPVTWFWVDIASVISAVGATGVLAGGALGLSEAAQSRADERAVKAISEARDANETLRLLEGEEEIFQDEED